MVTFAAPSSITKKPTPLCPSVVTASPARNVRSFIDAAIRSISFRSRSEKIGTRCNRSAGPCAMRGLCHTGTVKLTIVGCSPAWPNPGGETELGNFGEKFGVPGMFAEAFKSREYAEDEPFETCGLEITPIRVPHYQLQTFALRVSDGRATLAYSGDSAPSPKLAEVARDADLFLCEATLAQSMEGGNGVRGHLSAEEAVAAFEESGARRLVIIHRPDELPVAARIERACDGDGYQ